MFAYCMCRGLKSRFKNSRRKWFLPKFMRACVCFSGTLWATPGTTNRMGSPGFELQSFFPDSLGFGEGSCGFVKG